MIIPFIIVLDNKKLLDSTPTKTGDASKSNKPYFYDYYN